MKTESESIEGHTLLFLLSLIHVTTLVGGLLPATFLVLALFKNPVSLLLMLLVLASLEQLGFLLFERVLLQLLDHVKSIVDLLLVLLLEIDDSVNIDWLVFVISVLFVFRQIILLLSFPFSTMSERS